MYASIRDYVQKTHGMKGGFLYVAQMKVEFGRRGKAAKATRELVDTVREAAGFPTE